MSAEPLRDTVPTRPFDERLDAIYEAVLDFDYETVESMVRNEVTYGTDLQVIINDALIAAMEELGELFAAGEVFVPELLMAARAMKAGLEVLRPLLTATDIKPVGVVLMGTVHGDLHDIGKNLVTMMLEGGGFVVHDLGVNVSPEAFWEAAVKIKPDIIGLSALLTTTTPNMRRTIKLFRDRGWNGRIIVGGAPVSKDFAAEINADGYSPDAPNAVRLAKNYIENI
ncbi:MAG: hypothetical protein CBB68_09070 [Rhodospirillaceae bacterium TMED8]|nr:cobalamin-binding protein [Magnetovibrio sp.]OUT50510.1 MAG: hypothetical protein CBB68_09070 [Rhodospirillaceae bacterium TMED8]|tara:strand:- start:1302 stop:1979 length:678 start_codon:yes stop_codon:yes gene_type:complete